MNGRHLTRQQVLDWREGWSVADRERLAAELARLGVASCKEDANRGSVRCYDGAGTRVMSVYPGYVEFARGYQPETFPPGQQWLGYNTSIFRPNTASAPKPTRREEFCSTHGYPVEPGGRCWECD